MVVLTRLQRRIETTRRPDSHGGRVLVGCSLVASWTPMPDDFHVAANRCACADPVVCTLCGVRG